MKRFMYIALVALMLLLILVQSGLFFDLLQKQSSPFARGLLGVVLLSFVAAVYVIYWSISRYPLAVMEAHAVDPNDIRIQTPGAGMTCSISNRRREGPWNCLEVRVSINGNKDSGTFYVPANIRNFTIQRLKLNPLGELALAETPSHLQRGEHVEALAWVMDHDPGEPGHQVSIAIYRKKKS